jgi:hypothetical protein
MKNMFAVLFLFGVTLLNAPSHVHRIYVEQLHFPNNPDWDGFVRSKLISSLVQAYDANCSVVEHIGPNGNNGEDTADAVLIGDMPVQRPDNRYCRVPGAMRLVDKDGTVVFYGIQQSFCSECDFQFRRQYGKENCLVLGATHESIEEQLRSNR